MLNDFEDIFTILLNKKNGNNRKERPTLGSAILTIKTIYRNSKPCLIPKTEVTCLCEVPDSCATVPTPSLYDPLTSGRFCYIFYRVCHMPFLAEGGSPGGFGHGSTSKLA